MKRDMGKYYFLKMIMLKIAPLRGTSTKKNNKKLQRKASEKHLPFGRKKRQYGQ